jgi:hypothetical protein
MTLIPKRTTPTYKATIVKGTNAARWQKAAYVDHLPSNACPAGLNIQAWLGLAHISDSAPSRPLVNEIKV